VRVGTQSALSDTVGYSSSANINNRTGRADFRSEGRYHRVEVTLTGDFDTIQGADVEFSPQGKV